MLRLLFSLFILLAPTYGLHAQERITQIELVSSQDAIVKGEKQWLGIRIKMQPHWHVYWKNPGDSGIPTEVTWDKQNELYYGPIEWPVPEALPFDFLTNYGYEGEVILPLPFRYDGDENSVNLTGRIDLLVCKDICIPEGDDISLTLNVADAASPTIHAAKIEASQTRVPTALPTTGHLKRDADAGTVTFELHKAELKGDIETLHFYPITESVLDNSGEREWNISDDNTLIVTVPAGTDLESTSAEAVLHILYTNGEESIWRLSYSSEAGAECSTNTDAAPSKDTPVTMDYNELTLLSALLFAFLGGIILNAMPCVFPILSLKALSVAKYAQQEQKAVRAQGLAYTAGILVTFAAIVIPLIVLQQAGEAVGWGFQLQSPTFVAILILVVFGVGLSLSGMFHLPSFFTGSGPKDAHSLRGSFFTGVLSTLVATPCTGPFMAPALGFALAQPPVAGFFIFQMLGLGLAAPYLLISFVPATRKWLPKPGLWMERFKEFLAFPMYATAAWLLWVLVQQTGESGLLWVLAAAVTFALAMWSLKLHSRFWRFIWVVLAIITFVLALIKQDAAPPMEAMEFSVEQVDAVRAEGKPLFVYATAAWCITCKINENVALNTQTVQDYLSDEGIEVIVADWTNRGPVIRDYLASFGRSGVPLYVFYPSNGEPVLLPQLLTPALVVDEISAALQ